MNPTLRIEGVLLTMLDNRTNLGLEVVEEIVIMIITILLKQYLHLLDLSF